MANLGAALAVSLVVLFAPVAYGRSSEPAPGEGSSATSSAPAPSSGPAPPSVPASTSIPASAEPARLSYLPAGVPTGLEVQRPEDLRQLAVASLGASGATELLAILKSEQSLPATMVGGFRATPQDNPVGASFPYRYPALERLLDKAPGRAATTSAAQLGAALVQLAAVESTQEGWRIAGPAAFATLYRARHVGGCDTQLNLLLLLAADDWPRDNLVRAQASRAGRACGDHLTSDWLLGQFQSQRSVLEYDDEIPGDRTADRFERAEATFARLKLDYPASAEAWTGSGDMHLRLAMELAATQPFSGRAHYRSAQADYARAIEVGAGREGVLGLARALIGLGEAGRAARLLRDQLGQGPRSAAVLQLLLVAEEKSHDWSSAVLTAHELEELPAAPHIDPSRVFPTQDGMHDDLYPRAHTVISTGAELLTPMYVSLQPLPGGAGGDLLDQPFLPQFRPDDLVEIDAECPSWSRHRDEILAGSIPDAALGIPTTTYFRTVATKHHASKDCGPSTEDFRGLLGLARGESLATKFEDWFDVPFWDKLQNLWRWSGNYQQAAALVLAVDKATHGNDRLPRLRYGEILFLQGHHDQAAAEFLEAARRAEDGYSYNVLRDQALLDRGVALIAAQRQSEGLDAFRRIVNDADIMLAYFTHEGKDRDDAYSSKKLWAALAYHAHAQLGDAERVQGDHASAAEDYASALTIVGSSAAEYVPAHPEVVLNNAALADLNLSRVGSAEAKIRRAVAADPQNPVSLMTAGFVADRAGNWSLAAERNAAALRSDGGAFAAANDLGVELMRTGRDEDAVEPLRRAVTVRPDYALGWFNLGIASERLGRPLASQGALGHAFRLDPTLRERRHEPMIDEHIYRTGLDLSKPLPAAWSLADVDRRQPLAAAGLLTIAFVAVGLARATSTGGWVDTQQWLELTGARLQRLPLLRRMTHPLWAFGGTLVAFLLPLLRGFHSWLETTLFAVGIVVLMYAVLRVRLTVARHFYVTAKHRAWSPGLAVGVVAGLLGSPWAPLPTVSPTPASRPVHRSAPVVLAFVAALLFVEVALFRVPVTHSLAVAALIMAASLLVPVPPLDGGRLDKSAPLLAGGLAGATVLLLLGLL